MPGKLFFSNIMAIFRQFNFHHILKKIKLKKVEKWYYIVSLCHWFIVLEHSDCTLIHGGTIISPMIIAMYL